MIDNEDEDEDEDDENDDDDDVEDEDVGDAIEKTWLQDVASCTNS